MNGACQRRIERNGYRSGVLARLPLQRSSPRFLRLISRAQIHLQAHGLKVRRSCAWGVGGSRLRFDFISGKRKRTIRRTSVASVYTCRGFHASYAARYANWTPLLARAVPLPCLECSYPRESVWAGAAALASSMRCASLACCPILEVRSVHAAHAGAGRV